MKTVLFWLIIAPVLLLVAAFVLLGLIVCNVGDFSDLEDPLS